MTYTYDPIFAADPNNPATIAKDATLTIFDPADAAKAPVAITDVTGSPLANPIKVNAAGFGPAFQHATLDRVGWMGAGFVGYFTSYEGMRNETAAAKNAAQDAASNAAAAATAEVQARIEAGEFKGAPGKDGANVIPTQQAIEQAITGEGPVKAALSATILDRVDASRKAAVYSDFTTAPDGVPTHADSGQPVTHTNGWAGDTGANLRIINGRLTNTTTAAAVRAGYYTVDVGDTVTEFKISWIWSAEGNGTTGGGVAFINWKWNLPDGTIAAVPDASLHGIATGSSIILGIFDGGAQSIKLTKNWPTPPLKDGVTEYTVSGTINKKTQTVTAVLPWGEVVSYTDPRVETHSGDFFCAELYSANPSTAHRPGITDFKADTVVPTEYDRNVSPARLSQEIATAKSEVLRKAADRPPFKQYSTTGTFPVPQGSTAATVHDDITVSCTIPESGRIMVDLLAYVECTTAGRLCWTTSPSIYGRTSIVLNSAFKGYVPGRFIKEGLTPGQLATFKLQHYMLDSGVASIVTGGNQPLVMTATPL